MRSCLGLFVDKAREGVEYSSSTKHRQEHEREICGVLDHSSRIPENVPCVSRKDMFFEFPFWRLCLGSFVDCRSWIVGRCDRVVPYSLTRLPHLSSLNFLRVDSNNKDLQHIFIFFPTTARGQ